MSIFSFINFYKEELSYVCTVCMRISYIICHFYFYTHEYMYLKYCGFCSEKKESHNNSFSNTCLKMYACTMQEDIWNMNMNKLVSN